MRRVRSYNSVRRFVFLQIFFLTIAFSSFGQTKQSYRNHEEIDVGGGMKVEILKCYGEGPTEECDCIYFTDKRQNGTRMKQNANRIKEEERAANIAKGIKSPQRKSTAYGNNSSDNRADKAVPASLTSKVKKVSPEAALAEAAKKADSVAKASSQKMKERLSKANPSADSTEMDQVFIPKITETGGTRLESSGAAITAETSLRDSALVINTTPKDTAVNIPASTAGILTSPEKTMTVTEPVKNDSVAKDLPLANIDVSPDKNITVPEPAKKDSTIKDAAIASLPVSTDATNPDAVKARNSTISKDAAAEKKTAAIDSVAKAPVEVVIAAPATNSISKATIDTVENNWVKNYQNVKPTSGSIEKVESKPVQDEIKVADFSALVKNEMAPSSLASEMKAADSTAVSVPVATDKNPKRKEDKAKKQAAKVEKKSSSQNTSAVIAKNDASNLEQNALKDTSSIVAITNSAAAIERDSAMAKVETNKEQNSEIASPAASVAEKKVVAANASTLVISNGTAGNNVPADKGNLPEAVTNTSETDRRVIGKSAEVNTKGQWEKATIIDKETELLYKVHYRGRSADYDEWVSVTQIRNIDTATTNTPVAVNKTSPKSEKSLKGAAVPVPKVNFNCTFEAPAPPVSNADRFSERLAKRKIYEYYVSGNNGNNGVKKGVTFLSLVAEDPYVNTVSISATNNLEVKFSFAPAGAMIYPVKTQYKVCEQVLGRTSSKTIASNFGCFRNKEGNWTCANIE